MVELKALRRAFEEAHGKPARLFSAPGRVNLIGEHTDYNDGFVLPMAVNRRTFVIAAARSDRQVRVRAFDVNDEGVFDLDQPQASPSQEWMAYVVGVARELEQCGVKLTGSELGIASDVPIGAGLSSSAALEVSVGKSLLALAAQDLDLKELALAAQKAEHIYAGTKCGIMDQLTVACARKSHALLIDCRSLQVTHIPLNLGDVSIVVCNTNVKHELVSSAYNERRAECERCVQILQNNLPHVRALRDVSIADFERYADELPEPLRRRCRHVVTENHRTLEAATALRNGNATRLGELMVLSHQSLRDDYQVSCVELDTMVELALKLDGVLGARLTGGGFGGSTVNVVNQEHVADFTESIGREYFNMTNIEPSIYVVEADDGVTESGW